MPRSSSFLWLGAIDAPLMLNMTLNDAPDLKMSQSQSRSRPQVGQILRLHRVPMQQYKGDPQGIIKGAGGVSFAGASSLFSIGPSMDHWMVARPSSRHCLALSHPLGFRAQSSLAQWILPDANQLKPAPSMPKHGPMPRSSSSILPLTRHWSSSFGAGQRPSSSQTQKSIGITPSRSSVPAPMTVALIPLLCWSGWSAHLTIPQQKMQAGWSCTFGTERALDFGPACTGRV